MSDDAPTMDYFFEGNGLRLSAHLAEPPPSVERPPALVLCHGFPARGRVASASGKSFPELAQRIASEVGWLVLTINFRGSGRSEGNFSLTGWKNDIAAAVRHVRTLGVRGVWLTGFGSGGALCLEAAADDPNISGIAVLAAPADFNDWARNPRRLLLHAREVGVVTDDAFPPSLDAWSAELRANNPVRSAGRIAPRPMLIVHGEVDDLVPSLDARVLADEHGSAELRIVSGASHELRHDPRAVAVLLGWLSRQRDLSVAEAPTG